MRKMEYYLLGRKCWQKVVAPRRLTYLTCNRLEGAVIVNGVYASTPLYQCIENVQCRHIQSLSYLLYQARECSLFFHINVGSASSMFAPITTLRKFAQTKLFFPFLLTYLISFPRNIFLMASPLVFGDCVLRCICLVCITCSSLKER